MSKLRETLITNCEKKFLLKCLFDRKRLDGRRFDEFRNLEIQFGKDWGCCCVSLGKTCVLAQTSCEIQQPKSSRPSEGILNINIELNPLAAPHFEPGRQSELSVQLHRLLEKIIKDSKAVDLESLCIKTSEKVWSLRVDINVLNHEGNILDCASIAMLASLAHFRRPDVTCDGEEFIIHSYQQRDPIPTVIHHYPIGISFSIFNEGEYILADPSLLEEGIADAVLIIGLNGFKELCGLHLGGKAEMKPNAILSTVSKATSRASFVIDHIKNSLKIDGELRQKKCPLGFHINMNFGTTQTFELGSCLDQWSSQNKKKETKKESKTVLKEEDDDQNGVIEALGDGTAAYVPKEYNESLYKKKSEDDLIIIEDQRESIKIEDTDSDEDVVIVNGDEKYQLIN